MCRRTQILKAFPVWPATLKCWVPAHLHSTLLTLKKTKISNSNRDCGKTRNICALYLASLESCASKLSKNTTHVENTCLVAALDIWTCTTSVIYGHWGQPQNHTICSFWAKMSKFSRSNTLTPNARGRANDYFWFATHVWHSPNCACCYKTLCGWQKRKLMALGRFLCCVGVFSVDIYWKCLISQYGRLTTFGHHFEHILSTSTNFEAS